MTESEQELIYLASPYSHRDAIVRDRRFRQVCMVAARLMQQGKMVFSPIAHTHPIAVNGDLPTGWDFWNQYDRLMLSKCTELHVLRIPGWEMSDGVNAEIAIATELGIPIRFVDFNSND